jgi:hypothetical protein
MSGFADPVFWFERVGVCVLLGAITIGSARRLGRWLALGAGLAVPVVAILIPVPGSSVFGFVFGVIGPMSASGVITLLWLATAALRDERGRVALVQELLPLNLIVFVTGMAFYPLSLGLGTFDPYRPGFAGLALPLGAIAVLFLAWLARARVVALWLGLASCTALLDLHPSENLWDTLIDPVAFLISGALLAGESARRWRQKQSIVIPHAS